MKGATGCSYRASASDWSEGQASNANAMAPASSRSRRHYRFHVYSVGRNNTFKVFRYLHLLSNTAFTKPRHGRCVGSLSRTPWPASQRPSFAGTHIEIILATVSSRNLWNLFGLLYDRFDTMPASTRSKRHVPNPVCSRGYDAPANNVEVAQHMNSVQLVAEKRTSTFTSPSNEHREVGLVEAIPGRVGPSYAEST